MKKEDDNSVKIIEKLEKIADINQSKKDLQREINVIEVGLLWSQLTARYDIIETTNVLENFALDPDLKLILNHGKKVLDQEVTELEKVMMRYGIPLTDRPPAGSDSTEKVEVINDKYIFRRVFTGIQTFIPIHSAALMSSTSPKLREMFKNYLIKEIDLYDKLLVYGQLKGWVIEPPAYRV